MAIAGLFPGQGSQLVGMGLEFAQWSEVASELFHQADRILGFSLSTLCYEGPLERLTLTENAQPAILVTSVITYQLSNIPLKCAAGHSLGEYSAFVAAKVISFEDAVALVHKRGRYMQEAVPAGKGKMVAVLGPDESTIAEAAKTSGGICEIANINSPGQIVVAGEVDAVDRFSEVIGKTGAKIIPLNVSAPFHCSLMTPAAERLASDLDAIHFSDPIFPIYVNVTGESVTTGKSARELLKKQVCATVQWVRSIENLIRENEIEATVEFGAGGVLTKLLKRINQTPKRYEISTPDSLKKVLAALSICV